MLKININDYKKLNKISREFDKEISNLFEQLINYYDIYEISVKEFLLEFFEIIEKKFFKLDFKLSKIPLETTETNIQLNKMKEDSENLCVLIININSEGNNLKCCYKTLDLNLGKICPAFYKKPIIINIIFFVNEDMRVKVKTYKENKIDIFDDEEEKKENEENKEEEKKIKESSNIIKYEEEYINKLTNVKEYVKKGENIEIYVEIPQLFEKETLKKNSVIKLENIFRKNITIGN